MHLTSMTIDELSALLKELQEPAYRAKQVFQWLSRGIKPAEMTNLPKQLREKLSLLPYGEVRIEQKRVSQHDDTAKYLFALEDENLVEGVLMRYHYGNTACISTQVGCRMGCAFCASTLEGCVRNLSAGEMIGEVSAIERDEPAADGQARTVTNIVLMGSGEPMDNYDNVVRFLNLVSSPDGMGISPRNISVSTCGIVPQIERFMQEAPHVTLSISLHAHDNETRSSMMPVNNRYPIEELLPAAKKYADVTGRRVIFEYALVRGVNDSIADALLLAKRLRGMRCHVTLIPLNTVLERNLEGSTRRDAEAFCDALTKEHISATIRREMGADIEGACGQLRRRVNDAIRAENEHRETIGK